MNAARQGRQSVRVESKAPRNSTTSRGSGLWPLNQSEAIAASSVDISELGGCRKGREEAAGFGWLRECGHHARGSWPCRYSMAGHCFTFPLCQAEVYDVAGAGDTVISTLTLSLACGLGLSESAVIANCAAGAVVRKVGVATTSVVEITSLLTSSWNQLGLS